MSMSVGGLVSGLDIDGLVDQLMALEQQPLQQMQRREANFQADITAWNSVESKLQSLFDTADSLSSEDFNSKEVSVSDDSVLTAEATSSAAEATYDMTVGQLAQAYRVASDQVDSDYTVGAGAAGDIEISVTDAEGNPSTTTVSITEDMTLSDVASAINDEEAGVTASVVDNHLVVERTETGAHSTVEFTDTAGGLLENELGLLNTSGEVKAENELVAAQDASFTINGLDVTRASNTVADVVEGVTFELSQETASEVQVTVSADTSAMVDEVQSFVDAYNSAVSEMQGQVQEGGRLRGDSLLIATRSRLRLAISNPVEGMTSQYDRLSAIGITTEQDGTLVVDEAKLQEVYEADPQALEQVFFDESDGIKARVEGMLDPYLETAGVLDTREDYLQGEIGRVQDQMERLQDRLEMRRESLYREFTAMERMVSNLQNQGNALMAQLGMSNNQG